MKVDRVFGWRSMVKGEGAVFAAFCHILACLAPGIARGAPIVRAELPLSSWVDTEISTNLSFAAWERNLRTFTYELAFDATPSNNLEAAFGIDVDADGTLGFHETAFVIGWDCGRWFTLTPSNLVRRVQEPAAVAVPLDGSGDSSDTGPATARTLRVVFATGRDGAVRAASAFDGETPVFAPVDGEAPRLAYDPAWNLVRVTARGFDAASATFRVQTRPDGGTIVLR